MNLKRFVNTLLGAQAEECVTPTAAYLTRSYGAERGRLEGTPVVITCSFETPWKRRRKSMSPTTRVVHRKEGCVAENDSATPTILESNPIAQFLQPDDVGRVCKSKTGSGRKGAKAAKPKASVLASRCKGKPVTIPTVTQNLWSLRAVAPLIQWLQHHHVRYAYADWECQHTNGTRTRTVSQHGIVVEDREVATQAEYVCEASFGQNLYVRTCRTAYVPGSVSTYDWWSDVKAGAVTPLADGGTKHVPMAFSVRPSQREHSGRGKAQAREVAADGSTASILQDEDNVAPVAAVTPKTASVTPDPLAVSVLSYAMAGVYSQVRQHRVYRWDRATSVHLSTTDGKGYRVWIEHCVEEAGLQKEFRRLLVALAYHFSFHA